MVKVLTWIISTRSDKKLYTCPVCWYVDLDEAPYDEFGCSSYSICPCCGTEFGYDDSSLTHSELCKKWVSKGMPWWSKNQVAPLGWDPFRQLSRAKKFD